MNLDRSLNVGSVNDALSAASEQAAEAHCADELANAGIVLQDSRDFMAAEPPAFDWIIADVVAKGMKGDLNAKAKQWKSFFGTQLSLCVSTGRPFLNMQVPRARRVAYFNLELLERGFWERLRAMEAAMDATPANGMLYVANLRGVAGRLRENIPPLVADVRRLGIDFVIIDPKYKLFREGEDENSAAGLRGVLDFRDALAKVAAVLMIGHDPKGEVAGKGMADRGAGSYTAGADYDFSFALSPHVETGYSVLSTSCRYRKSPPDMSIRFDEERQTFEAEPDKPATVRPPKRGGGTAADPKEKAERARLKLDALEKTVRDFAARNDPMSMGTFRQAIGATDAGKEFSQNPLRIAIDSLVEKGVVAKTPEKVRTDRGEVRNKKNGAILVGAPEKIAAYCRTFEEPPL